MRHPCLSCGACCAHFRVAFHWSEADPLTGGDTPAALTDKLDPHRVVMRGTDPGTATAVRCIALSGTVGDDAHCSIYARRPSPCQALGPAWEHGAASVQCDRARAAFGLPALTPATWQSLQDPDASSAGT